jgi:hypothetical protein
MAATAHALKLPTSVWDPAWNDPEIAQRVGRSRYYDLFTREQPLIAPLLPADGLGRMPRSAPKRILDLSADQILPGTDLTVRASSLGLLESKESFGGGRPTIHMRALNLAVGTDSDGRFFLIGALDLDGASEKEATVVARFMGPTGAIAALVWSGDVNAKRVTEVQLVGADDDLERAYPGIRCVEVVLTTVIRR